VSAASLDFFFFFSSLQLFSAAAVIDFLLVPPARRSGARRPFALLFFVSDGDCSEHLLASNFVGPMMVVCKLAAAFEGPGRRVLPRDDQTPQAFFRRIPSF